MLKICFKLQPPVVSQQHMCMAGCDVQPVVLVGVIINDRVDVALAVGAHGVHVGQDDIPARTARHLLARLAPARYWACL